MPGLFLSLRGPRRRLLRIASLALVALQGAVLVSPLLEERYETRLDCHTEPDGTQHVNLHNEATCALCSARAQTSMPAQASPEIACPRLQIVAALESYAAPAREDTHNHRSRAPPLVS
ncbi:MAG: hypothetical protein ACHQQ3_09175 [Gemmatimonadales bacterium]